MGNYAVVSYKHKKGGYTIYEFGMMDKNGKPLKFSIKHHYKQNGKWKWDKWLKVPNGKVNEFGRYGTFKMDKIKVKFTTTSYKKI